MRLMTWVLTCALTAGAFASSRTENALMFELNQKGFSLLAQEIKNSQLQDISNQALPDVHQEVDHGIQADVEGMRFSVEFESLAFVPGNGAINVDLGVRKVHLEVDKARFSKKIVFTLSTTCQNTALDVGDNGPVHMTARLVPTVENHRIKLNAQDINFGIADNNFKVSGPRECSGALGLGTLIKWVVGKVISNSRGKIEETIRGKVASFIPLMEEKLNAQLIRSFPLAFKIPGMNEETKIAFHTSPFAVDSIENALGFRMSLDVTNQDVPFNDMHDLVADGGMVIGATGLNPAVLTEAFERVFPEGSAFVELTENLVPQIHEVLSLQTLSALWPDLKEQNLGANYLRGFVRFDGAPQFSVASDSAKVQVLIPNLQLKFMAHIGGEWRDYYYVNLKVSTAAIFDVDSGNLSVKLSPESVVSVTGSWAKGYEPKNPAFESELTEFLFSAVFEYLAGQGALTQVGLPFVNLGGEKIGVSRLDVKAPFIRAEVSSF